MWQMCDAFVSNQQEDPALYTRCLGICTVTCNGCEASAGQRSHCWQEHQKDVMRFAVVAWRVGVPRTALLPLWVSDLQLQLCEPCLFACVVMLPPL